MRNKLKFMAIMAAITMAAACSSDDDATPTTDAGTTDAGANDTAGSTKMQTCTEVGDCVIKARPGRLQEGLQRRLPGG